MIKSLWMENQDLRLVFYPHFFSGSNLSGIKIVIFSAEFRRVKRGELCAFFGFLKKIDGKIIIIKWDQDH